MTWHSVCDGLHQVYPSVCLPSFQFTVQWSSAPASSLLSLDVMLKNADYKTQSVITLGSGSDKIISQLQVSTRVSSHVFIFGISYSSQKAVRGSNTRSCKRSETLFKSLLFWQAGEVNWLAVEVLSPCRK